MYSVYADGVCIYDDRLPSDVGLYLANPTLTMEESAAGSFECDLIQGTFAYNAVQPLTTTIVVKRNDAEIWEGRVLTESKDFYNTRHIYCEGELAYLNDTYQPQVTYHDITIRQFVESIIAIHNEKAGEDKQFEVGKIEINDDNNSGFRYTQYDSTLSYINNIIEENGGHIYLTKSEGKRYLHIVKEFTNVVNQTVDFGSNLLDLTQENDFSSICSVLLPTGGVIANAGDSVKGEEIPITKQKNHYIDQYGEVYIDGQTAFDNFVCAWVPVEEYKTYYLTCRMRGKQTDPDFQGYEGPYCIYSFRRDDGNVLQVKSVSVSEAVGYQDFEDYEITAPAGANYVWVSGIDGLGLDLKICNAIEADEVLDEYVTVESVNDGSLYVVNQDLVDKYGWIERNMNYDDITDPETLLTRAQAYLKEDQFDNLTLEVKAIDLKLLGVDCNAIKIGDLLRVTSVPHGIDNVRFPVTEITIPLDDITNMTITLGNKSTQTLSEANHELSDDILARIAELPSTSSTLNSAKRNAAAMINNATSGYVTIKQGDDGTDEIIISDTPDYLSAQNVWRWNSGGLGFSDEGYAPDKFKVAMTADGAIVADFITAGEMSASRIRGDTLTLGGMDNENGICVVKNADSSLNAVVIDISGVLTQNQEGTWMKLSDGKLSGGINDDVYATINVSDWVQGDYKMVTLDSEVICLDSKGLVVSEGHNGTLWGVPDKETIKVVTSVNLNTGEVTDTELTFIKGILIT